MVSIIGSDKQNKKVDVTLDIQNIMDIINGLNMLVVDKEDEMNKVVPDGQDKIQYQRYKQLLEEMQKVKALVK